MKKTINLLFTILLTAILFMLSSCGENITSKKQDIIRINGELEETLEAGSEYVDKGVYLYPEGKYSVIIKGKINSTLLNKQEIKYEVYSNEGEFIKELHRFVTVVDTTPPTYQLVENKTYYVGLNYYLFDFISCSDNCTDNTSLFALATPEVYIFTRSEQQDITITLSDLSKNTTNVNISITPIFDFYEIAKKVSDNVTQGETEVTGKYINFRDYFRSKQISIMYYEESGSLHYMEEIDNKKSIQISAKFGTFSNADVTYHINGTGSTYSVAFAKIDATKESTSVNSYRLGINDLGLDESDVLEEFNEYIGDVLKNFQNYMESVLHLDIY